MNTKQNHLVDALDRIANGEFANAVSLAEQVQSLREVARVALAEEHNQENRLHGLEIEYASLRDRVWALEFFQNHPDSKELAVLRAKAKTE